MLIAGVSFHAGQQEVIKGCSLGTKFSKTHEQIWYKYWISNFHFHAQPFSRYINYSIFCFALGSIRLGSLHIFLWGFAISASSHILHMLLLCLHEIKGT